MSRISKIKREIHFIALIMLSASLSFAAQMYRVNKTTTVNVVEWSDNKNVTNNCTRDIMVPTKTSAEWTSFKNNKPACVTIADAVTCNCATTTLHGHPLNCASGVTQVFDHFCTFPQFTCAQGSHTYQCIGTTWTSIENVAADCVPDGVECP